MPFPIVGHMKLRAPTFKIVFKMTKQKKKLLKEIVKFGGHDNDEIAQSRIELRKSLSNYIK